MDGGKILKEELSDEIKATSPPANTHHILTICSNLKDLSGSDEQSVCHSCLDITAKMGLSSTELSNQELPTQLVSGVGRSQCCLALLNLLSQKKGCDINVQDSQGFSALHFLINGKCGSMTKIMRHLVPHHVNNEAVQSAYSSFFLPQDVPKKIVG